MTDASRTVAIIGAGPSGLMAADVLSEAGHRVVVFDQMRSPGRKFLLAGRGGLNITHSEDLDSFLDRYGPDRAFIEPAIRAFPPDAVRAWCLSLDEATFIGSSGRVFPESFRATPLLRALLRRINARGVEFQTAHRWLGWGTDQQTLRFSNAAGDVELRPDAVVLALGGVSWPGTGSTGSWVPILESIGVEVSRLRPANCGFTVAWSPQFASRFAGTPLKPAAFRAANAPEIVSRSEAVVTTTGIEGGAIYALGRPLRAAIDAHGSATLHVDLAPDRSRSDLRTRLSSRKAKESTTNWLRRTLGLQPVAIGLLREATANELPTDVETLAALIKAAPIALTGTAPIERAISTAGGVAQSEVDEQFALRRRPDVYVVGEMLDWDAPTGGYLLQACFSTAVAAATAIGG